MDEDSKLRKKEEEKSEREWEWKDDIVSMRIVAGAVGVYLTPDSTS